jgi:putative phosphonate metabolism protein
MPQRFAIYYAPVVTDNLWQRAATWLGRDPATGATSDEPIEELPRDFLAERTSSARRYGFHATIKPPMALAPGEETDDLRQALDDFASRRAPVSLGHLRIADLDGFLALIPVEQSPELLDFAADVVETFEPWRAPLSLKDRQARLAHGLTPRQEELLDAYGYPYVFDEFRFHMTLTDRLAEADRAPILAAAERWFAPALARSHTLDRLALFHEDNPPAPFTRLADYELRGV